MPLKASSIYDSGLFGESDFLSLSPTLSVDRRCLLDHVTGAKHLLHPLAEAALLPLAKGILFHKWLIYMLDEQLTYDEIVDIILFLNGIGGLEVRRFRFSSWKLAWKRFIRLALGFGPSGLARRRAANFRNIVFTTSLCSLPLVIASMAVGLLFYASGLLGLKAATFQTAIFLSLVLSSVVIHEYAHLRLIKSAPGQKVIFRRGLRLGLLHRPLSRRKEAIAALGGPLAGILASASAAIILYHLTNDRLILATCLIIIVFHLASLLPAYGDGQSLKRIWSRKAI